MRPILRLLRQRVCHPLRHLQRSLNKSPERNNRNGIGGASAGRFKTRKTCPELHEFFADRGQAVFVKFVAKLCSSGDPWRALPAIPSLFLKSPCSSVPEETMESTYLVKNIREILDILPHRYPFLLVDRIVESDGS